MSKHYYQYNCFDKVINYFKAGSGNIAPAIFDFHSRISTELNYMIDYPKGYAISNIAKYSAVTKIKCIFWSFTGVYQDDYPNKRQRWLVFKIKR